MLGRIVFLRSKMAEKTPTVLILSFAKIMIHLLGHFLQCEYTLSHLEIFSTWKSHDKSLFNMAGQLFLAIKLLKDDYS